MLPFIIFIIICIYFLITRGIPRALSWFLVYRYQVQIKIGRISLPSFSFEDVSIKKASISIKIDRIRASSSLFNQDERKLFAVKIHDVRIEREQEVIFSQSAFTSNVIKEKLPVIEDLFENATLDGKSQEIKVDPLQIRVPPSVVSLAQFFGVHVISINVMFLRDKWPECLVHISADKVIIEGSTVNDTNVAVNVNVMGSHIRILQKPDSQVRKNASGKLLIFPKSFTVLPSGAGKTVEAFSEDFNTDITAPDPSLMECTLSFKLYVEVKSESWAEMQNISLQLNSSEFIFQERLFAFLEDKALVATPVSLPTAKRGKNMLNSWQLLHKYWLFIPQKLRFKCDCFNVKFMNYLRKTAVCGSVGTADLQTHFMREGALENLPMLLPDLSAELQLDQIQLNGHHDTVISITRIALQQQFIGDRINVKIEVETFCAVYDYRDLAVWLKYTPLRKSRKNTFPPKVSPVIPSSKESISKKQALNPYCVGIILEVWDVSVQAYIPSDVDSVEMNIVPGIFLLQHSKNSMVLTQGMGEVAGEIVIETLVISLGNNLKELGCKSKKNPIAVSKRSHYYGTNASVGLCIVEFSSAFPPSVENENDCFSLKIESLIDNVQLEWSNKLATFISSCQRYLKSFRDDSLSSKVFPKEEKELTPIKRRIFSVDVKFTALNLFLHTDSKVSCMVRIDLIKSSKTLSESKISLEGIKATKFAPTGSCYQCIKSLEIMNEFLNLRAITFEENGKEFHITVGETLLFRWSTSLHRTFLLIKDDVKKFTETTIGKTPSNTEAPSSNLKLQFVAKGDLRVCVRLSPRHSVDFAAGDFIYLMADGIISVRTDELKVMFDEHEIFLIREAQLVKMLNSVDLESEREGFSELSLKQNKSWKVTMTYWKVTFPYQYNFAEAFTEDFISIFKWIKKVHNHKPKPFTEDSPLPPDIIIQVTEYVFEVCDDPFEVKLRYNYELMEDEYHESCKRIAALEKKIEETRKTNLQLSTGKIESLFKILQQKNSETYVKRSKKMYEKEPVRTQLFLWKMEKVLIYAFADPSFHGTEKVLQNMRDIDSDSPWPEEGIEFTTLWCRMVSATCSSWRFNLRDYPQPLWDISVMEIYGRLIGAEPKPTKRAKRTLKIDVEEPFTSDEIERSLTSLKFYHDLTWEAESFNAAYGPCWEPAMSQFNLALCLINRPSLDPSLPLPWWDKMRLLFHGRLILLVDQMTLLLHASLDPYNTTEEMELTWNELTVDWTNANLVFKGDLNVLVRTASKYDDVRLMNLPNLKISVKLSWVCRGNPNDHHVVMQCAPDKVPEYSINQEHDSYRVFRSQCLKMNLGLETKSRSGKDSPIEVIFYGSTLRWFENLKFIISGVTRPTRRGILFKNTTPRKPQLSRHYHSVHLSLSFQRFAVTYWLSARVKKGFQFTGERLSLSSEHNLSLIPINDGLRHRPRTCWSIIYLSTELWEAQIWLINAMDQDKERSKDQRKRNEVEDSKMVGPAQLEKFYFLNVTKVEYMRETLEPSLPFSVLPDTHIKDTPNHRLVVHNLKGVWTTSNRDIVFAVYDSWTKSQQLKRNLAPDVIKSFTPGETSTPQKPRNWTTSDSGGTLSPTSLLQVGSVAQGTPSPRTRLQSDHTTTMLQQLIAEADNNYIAYAEDCSTPEPRDQTLQGVKAACSTDDVIYKKWLIQLVNSQVLLKGCETNGYVIISAAKSQICQRIHRPAWRSNSLVTKATWSGSLECMQYYATVSERNQNNQMDNIMWLTLDNIEEKDCTVINEVTDIVGSGQSVGGVVSQTVGISNQENESVQLQRIVSRCRCEFFYVNYGETGIDHTLLGEVYPPTNEEGLWNNTTEAADTFTLMHYDLCASTNYLQYNMVLDILNNLLLYIDPKKKEASEALARMRFKLQLYSREDQRKPIIQLQNQVRYHLSQLRFLEKEVYLIQRQMDKEPTPNLVAQRYDLECQAAECKEKVNSLGEELAMRIHCFNETQLSANHKLAAAKGDRREKSLIRMNEVYFRKAQWRLTEEDGQLGIAQLDLSNFVYSKKTYSDDITEHLLELGFINVSNLLPNQIYKDVLAPAELRSGMPVDRQKTLRIYCREKPPCGGIAILEHFEINVVPLKIELTYQFFKTMLKFCFPYNNTDDDDVNSGSKGEKSSSSSSLKKSNKVSNFYVDLQKDDVEIMKQRAEQNKHFVFIKIPELPVSLSYKGKKEKNIEDVHNSRLVVPTLEYHSVTWTWLDLLLAIKMGSKSALVSQAIKHKLNLSHFRAEDSSTLSEDDKARLLLGNKHMAGEAKGHKKSLFNRLNR